MRLHRRIADCKWKSVRRPGLSLTEVLIAMFVMAIGMISLLTLFPIGMLNMSAAMRQSRQTYVAAIAQAQAEMARPGGATGVYTLRNDTLVPTSLTQAYIATQATALGLGDQYAAAGPFFDNTTVPAVPSPWWPWLFDTTQAGPPVFVDPQGQSLWPHRTVGTDAGNVPVTVQYKNGSMIRSFGIRRIGVSFAASPNEIRRTFMIEDELTFEPNGEVRVTPTGLIERERRYSWGYLWRRPRFNESKIADLATVIFSGRQVEGVANFGNAPEPYFRGYSTPVLDPEWAAPADPFYTAATCQLAFKAGSTKARLQFDATVYATLPAKRGDWLLDATVIPPRTAGAVPAHFNAYFYKIVGVGDPVQISGNNWYQELELARPALADGYVGAMITGLADVVEKNDGKMPPG